MLAEWALVALVVINEVRYDPPGADAGGEYVELLNTSADAVDLDASWSLERGNGGRPDDWAAAWFGDGTRLEPGGRLVLGDDPRSSLNVVLGLQNGPDACRLVRAGAVVDLVGWGAHIHAEYVEGAAAPDPAGGHIVRWPDGVDTNVNARDFREADIETPGSSNSPERWLSLGLAWPSTAPPHLPAGSPGTLELEVTNAGTAALPAARCGIDVTASHERLSRWTFERHLPSGASRSVSVSVPGLPPGATSVRLLPWHVDAVIGGAPTAVPLFIGYHDVVVNEVMADPAEGEPEWFEVRGVAAVGLTGWAVRDASGGRATLSGELGVDELLVFTPDRGALLNARVLDPGRVVEVSGWPSLNNDGETLAILDERGAVRDAVTFDARSGESLERVNADIPSNDPAAFVAAPEPTPGAPNRARATLPTEPVFEITPAVVTRDPVQVRYHFGDGVGDVRLLLADAGGRLRGEIYRHRGGGSRGAFVWAGELNGRRVRPGLYVVVAEYETATGERRRRRASVAVSWTEP